MGLTCCKPKTVRNLPGWNKPSFNNLDISTKNSNDFQEINLKRWDSDDSLTVCSNSLGHHNPLYYDRSYSPISNDYTNYNTNSYDSRYDSE